MQQSRARIDGVWGLTLLGGVAALTVSAGLIGDFTPLGFGAVLTSAILGVAAILVSVWLLWGAYRRKTAIWLLEKLVQSESVASFVISEQGTLVVANAQALKGRETADPAAVLGQYFASPVETILRLQNTAARSGKAVETIKTRNGGVSLNVLSAGRGFFFWQVRGEQPAPSHSEPQLPSLTASPSGTILFMNEAMRRLIGTRTKSLERLFGTRHLVSGRNYDVETVEGPIRSVVATNQAPDGRQEIYLLLGVSQAMPPVANWDAIEDLPVPLMKIARSGEVIAANRETRALMGADINEMTRLSDLLEGLGRPMGDWIEEVATGRATKAREFLRGKGDWQDFFVQVALFPTDSVDNSELIAVLNDMTEFKALEAQFVQSQKMQAIGQLAGGVAHDFNNLLTAISGHCDLLLLRHEQDDENYSDLIQIHQNANRAAALVSQLLAFSRKQTLSVEVIHLANVLSDLTHLLNRLVGERIQLVFAQDADLFPIRADKRQLEQVIMNLVVNARDAMPLGGEIRVDCENIELRAPIKRDRVVLPAGRYAMISVVDEGSGISQDKLGKIFEPFYTTKRPGEGTGLGLSTAYGIVKQSGGFIFAESEIDVGSCFTLYFPAFDGKETSVAEVSKPAALPALERSGAILLVEDEAPVRAFAARALRLKGFEVIEADSGESALEILSDPELKVDVFVTDVIMPGKDGPTWVKEALENRPDARVVFVSGYAEDAFGEDRARLPDTVFLPKPFSLTELTETVQSTLDQKVMGHSG